MNVATLRSSSTTRMRTSSTLLRPGGGRKFVVHGLADRLEVRVRGEWIERAQSPGDDPLDRLTDPVGGVRREDGHAPFPPLLPARRDDDEIARRKARSRR